METAIKETSKFHKSTINIYQNKWIGGGVFHFFFSLFLTFLLLTVASSLSIKTKLKKALAYY